MRRTYLDPMSPDGKTPGVVREIEIPEAGIRSVMAPVSYLADHAGQTRAAMETERDALIASLPNLSSGGARAKADHQIRILEREIRKALDMEEAAKRTAERVGERKAQAGGVNNAFTGTMCELKAMVKSAGAAVATLIGAVKPAAKKIGDPSRPWGTGGWAAHLKWIDADIAKRALDQLRGVSPQGPMGHHETAKPAAVVHAQNSMEDSIYKPV